MFVREIQVDGAVPAEAAPDGNETQVTPRFEQATPPAHRKRRLAMWIVGLAVLGGAGLLATNRPDTAASTAASASDPLAAPALQADVPAIPVNTSIARVEDVAIYRTGLGSVQAFNTVSVTSRVEGQLDSILFEEGQEVEAGTVLAKIDDRGFQAALRAKEAQLRSARARTQTVKADLDRVSKLLKADVGSRQTYETQLALLEQSEAEVDAAVADLDNARLQLDYATIRSPIAGKVGFRQIDVGNMIRIGDRTVIAVVTQVQPINVVFTLPQEDLLDVVGQLGPGKTLPVAAMARDGRLDLGTGTLSTIDNQVDPSTGTFKLKAEFANENKALWPGEFVTVKLLVQHARDVVVIPAPAVQRGPQGAYVYVVSADEKAEMRSVDVTLIQDGMAVIASGVAEGDRVVVDGQFKLAPGSRVAIADAADGATQAETTPTETRN